MPNRIIKESICTSENINSLSPGAEVLFYRLIVKADDFGCYHGNVKIIKGACYPLKSDVIKDKQMMEWIGELIKAKLIFIYTTEDGKQYIKLTKWEKHQQKRANKPKFPLPQSSDINCNQPQANVPENENENENENEISKRETRNENDTIPTDFFKDVISYLNEKAGTSYRPTSQKTKDFITARFNEKYTLDDFKKVINNKVADWNHEPTEKEKDMRSYIRPETLFSNKFESYLNSKPAVKSIAHRDNFEQRQYDDEFWEKFNQSTIVGGKTHE